MSIWLSWSSGKDCAWALHELRSQGRAPSGLFTTLNAEFDRVAMHGVRRRLLEAQAAATGLPLTIVDLPWPCPNADYEA
ncbi:MAG: ATP-binding protein, partial [Hyphomicrobiaceae bacterium]